MNTIEGRLQTILRVETFTLKISDDLTMHSCHHFDVVVDWEYWPEVIAKDFEEPNEDEYLEVSQLYVLDKAYLTDEHGWMMSIDPRAKLMDVLTHVQYNAVADSLRLKQGSVKL
jgi:hypothetical protein